MAQLNNRTSFKNCQISYEDDTITEFTKDGVNVYALSAVLEEFSGDEQFIDVTFAEKKELTPLSQEG